MIYAKLRTTLKMLLNSPKASEDVSKRVRVNLGQLRIRLNGGKPFTYTTPLGFKYTCIPQSKVSTHLYLQGLSETEELKLVKGWLRPGDTCFDLGANVGYYSALMADRVGSAGRVAAVEPGPTTFKTLSSAMGALGYPQVSLVNVCASDADGTVDFMVAESEIESVFQSMFIGEGQNYNPEAFQKVEVEAKTLNALLDEYDCRKAVSLVKIDIEGAEPMALHGATHLFEEAALPLFIIEINQQALNNFGFTASNVLSFFPEELFRIFILNFNYWEPHPHYEYGRPYEWRHGEEGKLPDVSNMIFVPKVGKYADRWGQIGQQLVR